MKIMHSTIHRGQQGFSFIDVLVGILIFAVGMLALGALQTALTRSQAASHSQAVASGIAERIIERAQGFSDLGVAGSSTFAGGFAYNEITAANIVNEIATNSGGTAVGSTAVRVTVGGVEYTITPTVTDYYWNEEVAPAAFTTTQPTGAVYSDFKQLEVAVTWSGADFVGAEAADDGRLGSGVVNVTSVISSVTSPSSVKVQNSSNTALLPPISYTPGDNPDIVSLNLGGSRFKESTLPEPRVNQRERETTWDVVTYTTNEDATSSFLRREEFRTVACTCEFGELETAPEPVFWAGDEYVLGEEVTKRTGVNAAATGRTTVNSRLCDRCCANHHDRVGTGGDGYRRYRPFNNDVVTSGGLTNHVHYNFNSAGDLVPVDEVAGNEYLEACRMVRVDGFWQVAQDLRNEQRFVVPGDWLDETGELETYSSFLVGTGGDTTRDGAVERHFDAINGSATYPTDMPCWLNQDGCTSGLAGPLYSAGYPVPLAAGRFPSWTGVLVPTGENQLRSRGLYIDHMHPDLRGLIACLDASDVAFDDLTCGGDVGGAPGVGVAILDRFETSNALEIMPFFELQLTSITPWRSLSPIDVTSDAIGARNFSRGLATADAQGDGDVSVAFRQGNIGLLDWTGHLPTDVAPQLTDASLDTRGVDSAGSDGGSAGDGTGTIISGTISPADNSFVYSLGTVGSVNAENCGVSSGAWACIVQDFALLPTFTVELINAAGGATAPLYLCDLSGELTIVNTPVGTTTTATISLSVGGSAPVSMSQNLEVRATACL